MQGRSPPGRPESCAVPATIDIAQRPGLADHIGVLPAMQVIDLDYPAAAEWGIEIITAT